MDSYSQLLAFYERAIAEDVVAGDAPIEPTNFEYAASYEEPNVDSPSV